MRLGPFDGLPNNGQQKHILEIELDQAGGQQVGLFASRQASLDDDSPLPVDDAEASPAGQLLGRQRGVGHWDPELFGQPFKRCQQSFVLHGLEWDRALARRESRGLPLPLPS